MTPQRALQRLLAHALAEGSSGAEAVRGIHGAQSGEVLSFLEAGRLRQALVSAGLSADLTSLAEAWPSALLPAQTRLERLCAATTVRREFLTVLLYGLLLTGFQQGALALIESKVLIQFTELTRQAERPLPPVLPILDGLQLLLLAWIFILLVGVAVQSLAPEFTARALGAGESAARRASLMASLVETGAPAETRRLFDAEPSTGETSSGSAAEWDLIAADLDRSAGSRGQRRVGIFRFIGMVVPSGAALAITTVTYHSIAILPP